MNNLVIIGNGFDLAHGLKTKYSDFILDYLNTAIKSLSNNYNYHDKLMSISSQSRIPSTTLLSTDDFINKLKNYSIIQHKYKFDFIEKLIHSSQNSNWIDIENLYYKSLIDICSQPIKNPNFDISDEISKANQLNTCFTIVQNLLFEYLSKLNITNVLINEEIATHFKEIISLNGTTYNNNHTYILNFNYTSTVELYTNLLTTNNYTLNYIHGNIHDTSRPKIFGYGDELDSYYSKIENLNTNEFLKNFKSFKYLKTTNYQDLTTFINKVQYTVYIIGHSCGLSDRILLNSIFENKNCMKIKILYHQEDSKTNDYTEKTMDISRHFSPESKNRMRNIIVPYQQSKPLIVNNI